MSDNQIPTVLKLFIKSKKNNYRDLKNICRDCNKQHKPQSYLSFPVLVFLAAWQLVQHLQRSHQPSQVSAWQQLPPVFLPPFCWSGFLIWIDDHLIRSSFCRHWTGWIHRLQMIVKTVSRMFGMEIYFHIKLQPSIWNGPDVGPSKYHQVSIINQLSSVIPIHSYFRSVIIWTTIQLCARKSALANKAHVYTHFPFGLVNIV